MESRRDLVEYLGPDTSAAIFTRLDRPADVVRLCAVSRSWRHFVIANGLCKKLCLRLCPEISNLVNAIEVESSLSEETEVRSGTSLEWKRLQHEHMAYAYLSSFLVLPTMKTDCILESLGASSTDRYPDEIIENTLVESDTVNWLPSYWSSKGEINPRVSETLTYRLSSRVCVVDEIKIKPCRVMFYHGNPIYSAEAVRFKMGYSRYTQDKGIGDDNNYVWLYVSPKYQMVQEYDLQPFKLPRRVVCIGGIVQIELIGRPQKCEVDGLCYICISYVQVLGLPLPQVFDVNMLESSR